MTSQENGTIVVHLPKEEPGREFEDLDLLTKLLQPKKSPAQIDLHAPRYATPHDGCVSSCGG
ncbi:hypothetical protein PINS_up002394 [Pythium insidiosum]|nr:hypothetical protein PINS_up002394 [Pythium insidiosum]